MPRVAAASTKKQPPRQPRQPRQLKPCKDTEFRNPFTRRCMSKKNKVWVSLVAQSRIRHTFLMERKREIKIVDLNIDFFGPKTLSVTGRPARMFDTVQAAFEAMSDTVTKMVDAGWTLDKAEYDKVVQDVRRMLDGMFTCALPDNKAGRRASQKKENPVSIKSKSADSLTCLNDSTLVMMDPIASVPPQRLVQLQDTYCFDVEELVDAILSTDKLMNPLTQVALTEQDAQLVVDKAIKAGLLKEQIKKLKALVKRKTDIYITLRGTKGFATLVHGMLLAGVVCLCDYTPDFAPAQRALGQLGEVMRGFKRMDLAFSLTNTPGSKTLGGIMKSYGNQCIHGVGFALLDIVFHTLVKCPGLLPELPPEVRRVNDHSFCLVRLSHGDTPYAVYVYDDRLPKGNMMRLCYFLTLDEPPVFKDVFASGGMLTLHDAQQYYKKSPDLFAALDRGFTAVDTGAKMLNRICKRIIAADPKSTSK